MNIAVWFSSGAASAVAAIKTLELYKDKANVRVVNNPVIEEHIDNKRFLKDVESYLGVEIETATNPKYPLASAKEVWAKHKVMSLVNGAPCTMELKKRARLHFELNNKVDWHVLGFTYDEKKRSDRFMQFERKNLLPVLIDLKITKNDCFKILNKIGIDLPQVYKLGFPNANCIGCVKATSPTYWNHVREKFPDVFKDRLDQSKELGARLVRVKNKRIFLHELDPLAKGRDMKKMDIDCGIFCEEKEL